MITTVIETRNNCFEYDGRCRVELQSESISPYIKVFDALGKLVLIIPHCELKSIEFQEDDD